MEQHSTISSEIYKYLGQQKVQQKVHNIYVALFIKWFVFNKLVNFFC